jgi:hypothetical protein
MGIVAVAVVVAALDQPPTYLSRLFAPENLPNIALVVVGIAGIITAVCTLKIIRTQTFATVKAAEAALLNAQAVIKAERPWMIIEPTPIPHAPLSGYVSFDAYNRGRTPAEITNYQGDFFFHGIDEGFDLEPTFAPLERLYREYISPGNKVSVYTFSIDGVLASDQWQWMHQEQKRLYFKGRIVYRDLITHEEHESRFCYWLSPAEGVGLIMGGDRNWNKYT